MSIVEQIVERVEQLSPAHQQEALDFIEFLLEKERLKSAEPSAWSFSWAGGLKDLNQTADEVKKELKELWLKTD